ncbi:hypothetical protein N6H14_22275 [Paenibacillus sp. CC-CFT747]|nr:hypothetical protein N6H14_22275 [Paenibacillus sp. CC-CFT747]
MLDGNGRLEVAGEGLSGESAVWLNGRKLETRRESSQRLVAWVPEEDRKKAGHGKVQVRITDLKNTQLSRSNELEVTAKEPASAP